MLGLVIFIIILLVYSFLLSVDALSKLLPVANRFFTGIQGFIDQGAVRIVLAIIGIVTGIWNFFAPDFTAMYSPPVVGALVPSLLLIFDSTVLYPEIIEILNISDEGKRRYYDFINRFKAYSGLITLIFAVLHILLFRQIIL